MDSRAIDGETRFRAMRIDLTRWGSTKVYENLNVTSRGGREKVRKIAD